MHRLLQAAIEQDQGEETAGAALAEVLQIDAKRQQQTCKHCNQKKSNAKSAQEQSDKIYMCVMVREHPIEEDALVLETSKDWAQVFIFKYGIDIRACWPPCCVLAI